jgi:rhodanese-related sulfurtransferase
VGNDVFAVRLGSVLPFGTPVVLLTTAVDAADRLRRQLATIGYEDVRGLAEPMPDTDDDLLRVRVVGPRDAREMAGSGAQLVDVREIAEYELAHAPGALHIPYSQLEQRLGELPIHGDIVVYCAGGVRSSLAVSILERHGIAAANLRGGFDSWVGAGLPTEA